MDRRCSDRRIQIETPAELVAEGGTRFSCHVTDVSVGGARVEIGLQFGLLGARETHLITSLAIENAQTLGGQDVAWIG